MSKVFSISPLKFYSSLDEQAWRKSYAYSKIMPVIFCRTHIEAFQICFISSNVEFSSCFAHSIEDGTKVDITGAINRGLQRRFIDGNTIFFYSPQVELRELNIGMYYLEFNAGGSTAYSDVFSCRENVNDCIRVTYRNSSNLSSGDSLVLFESGFYFSMYLRTDVGKPKYTFEEEATRRLGYEFIESQVSKKEYSFSVAANEPICDALRVVKVCTDVVVETHTDRFETITFDVDIDWKTEGDIAEAKCTFSTDEVIVNLGGYHRYTSFSGGHADTSNYAENTAYAEFAKRAETAGSADTLSPNSEIYKMFLSRLADDVAKGKITFEKGIEVLRSLVSKDKAFFESGIEIGNFIASIYNGTGAAIDGNGNAEVESLKVRTFMEVMELVINRVRALDGDQMLTESDVIEDVSLNTDGTFKIKFKEQWKGYWTAQKEGNILKGIVNTLEKGEGTYVTSWMRVLNVNPAANEADVIMYSDNEVPGGKNFPPVEMMRVARWGNVTDKSRQSTLYLSSHEGRIVKLSNVTHPIIDESKFGFVIGEMPDFIKNSGLPIGNGDYAYFKGLVVQDILRMDYKGNAIPEYVDRGQWVENPSPKYCFEEINQETKRFETSDVWYLGCKWRCIRKNPTTKPSFNSPDWAMLEGNPFFKIDLSSSNGYEFEFHEFKTTLSVVAFLYNQDVTQHVEASDVTWSRDSYGLDGKKHEVSDAAWNARRSKSGKSIQLTIDDVDEKDNLSVYRITCTVLFRDGATDTASLEYML